jgi:hypothetical protein
MEALFPDADTNERPLNPVPGPLGSSTLQAQCYVYWPYLVPLWYPKSRMHWVNILKRLCLLTSTEFPIPSTILLSAAYHGDAVLVEDPKLRELAMKRFLDPLHPLEWYSLLRGSGQRHEKAKEKMEDLEASEGKGFEPENYEDILLRLEHATPRASPIPMALNKSDEYEVLLRRLYELVHKQAYDRQQRQMRRNIWMAEALDTDVTLPAGENCPICLECLVRNEDLVKTTITAFDKANVHQASLVLPCSDEEGHNWTKSLRDGSLGALHPPLQVDENELMKLDILNFEVLLFRAFLLLRVVKQSMCIEPLKDTCGHMFGASCIMRWLDENGTCPLSRRKLRPHINWPLAM